MPRRSRDEDAWLQLDELSQRQAREGAAERARAQPYRGYLIQHDGQYFNVVSAGLTILKTESSDLAKQAINEIDEADGQ